MKREWSKQLPRPEKSLQFVIPILGNHEEMMLRVIEGKESHQDWLRFGGVETWKVMASMAISISCHRIT